MSRRAAVKAPVASLPRAQPAPTDGRWLLDQLGTAVLLFDRSLRLCYANMAGRDLLPLGLQRGGSASTSASPLLRVVQRALHSNLPYTGIDLEVSGPGGHALWLDYTVTPLADDAGLLVELYSQGQRLRRRLAREHGLHAAHEAARESVRQVAHEVKNPLGGIRGAAQLLQRELTAPAHREMLAIVIGETDRLRTLVDRMLAGERRPRRGPVNIHELLEHVHALVQAECPPGVRLEREYDPSLPELQADREQLVQCLLNLLRNALQAVGAQGCVRLCSRAERRCMIGTGYHRLAIRVDVLDDGPGLPAGMEHTVFYPMVSTREGGTGLGLPIAQALAHGHGGLVSYEREGAWTVFSLLLPLQHGDDHRER